MTPQEVQQAVAEALGASPEVAAGAVAALDRHGALEHGVLFLAVLASARWGTDAAEALRRIAEGAEPPASWSDYEARTARDEAQEEAAAALRRAGGGGLAPQVEAVLRGQAGEPGAG